jgi:hypothetical protein
MIDPEIGHDTVLATTNRTLRQFAIVWILFLGGLATLAAYGRGRWTTAYALGVMALAIGLPGLAVPHLIRPVFVGSMALTAPIGWVTSKVLVIGLFYGVFTPMALFFKLIRRDALALRPNSSAETYWLPKPTARDVHSYFRQS